MDLKPMSPQEVGEELKKMNEAKEADQSNQLDRIEKKIDFLISIQEK